MNWRHYPWMLGLCLAPVLFGSVTPVGQTTVAVLFAISLILLLPDGGRPGTFQGIVKPAWAGLALICLVLPLIPLPVGLVEVLSPQRVALARRFPIDAGVTSGWLPLTLSPANTVQRWWELALIVTAFWLARLAAAEAGFSRRLVFAVGATLLVLAGSDLWFRLTGQQRLLGLWPNAAGHAAGTFANRNHFAGWIYVAALFCSGWLLRQLWPLQSARQPRRRGVPPVPNTPARPTAPNPPEQSHPSPRSGQARSTAIPTSAPKNALFPSGQAGRRSYFGVLLLALTLLFALIMAVSTGSRAGLLAFVAGIATWTVLLARRSRNPKRWLALGVASLLGLMLLLAASNYLLDRLVASRSDLAFKLAIWKDALTIGGKFPLLGVGPGSFVTAFNHFKTFGGDHTFLHAENEYVQLLVEHGLLGTLLLGGLVIALGFAAFRYAGQNKLAEPEMIFSALAGLVAFAVHSLFDFPFQIPANALLAAALLGFVLGHRDQAHRAPVLVPARRLQILITLGWAAALLAIASLQALAWWHWQTARRATSTDELVQHIRRSVELWPWSTERPIVLARAQVKRLQTLKLADASTIRDEARRIRRQLHQAMTRDPFNWELRLERAWLDLAYWPEARRSLEEAWEVTRLNPLQPKIPLRFARHFRTRNPELAMKFVRTARLSTPEDIYEALRLAWEINHEPAQLWELVPPTRTGLDSLARFAADQQLMPLAAQARER